MSLDPETAELLHKLGLMPDPPKVGMRDIGVAAAREGSRAVFLGYAGEASSCLTEDIRIPGSGQPVPARLYHLSDERWRASPVVVFFHGGGWAMGDLDCYDFFMRDMCARSGATILSVDYRLAPEHKYPAALEDGLAAVHWAARFADTHGGGARRLAVMGDSAGGNLAAVIARRLHTHGRVRLAAQFLLYPMLDVSKPHSAYPSRMRFGDGGYLLTRESIDTATAWYLDGVGRPEDPDVSPLLVEDVSILPETLIVVGGFDPLLDEARAYVQRLREGGVAARLEVFESAIHAFLSFGVLEVARQGRAFLAEEIRRCLLS